MYEYCDDLKPDSYYIQKYGITQEQMDEAKAVWEQYNFDPLSCPDAYYKNFEDVLEDLFDIQTKPNKPITSNTFPCGMPRF